MEIQNKATRINLFSLRTTQMRSFHITWFAFFLCFFGWFGIAPLMAIVREDLMLTKAQIGNTIIASVAITVLFRLLSGPLCDRFGARLTYTWVLLLGSLPVMGIGLARSYESFLLFRLAIGAIGAAFVITQYHTSMMFAPNCVGTANAATAGWGNVGAGATQMLIPLIFSVFLMFGVDKFLGWRLAMVVPGVVLFFMGLAYYFCTQDAPDGNYKELRAQGKLPPTTDKEHGSFLLVAKDYRVWALFVIYAACFGMELTINNIAALYYYDRFQLDVTTAGLIAGLFGLMNIFARALGGICSDRFAKLRGLKGRVQLLGVVLFLEGIALIAFSRMPILGLAVAAMLLFGLLVQMASGATFGVVPFINKKAVGPVAGIVGAGGNAGAVLAGFLFRIEALATQDVLLLLGVLVTLSPCLVLLVRFSEQVEAEQKEAFVRAGAEPEELRVVIVPDEGLEVGVAADEGREAHEAVGAAP